MSDTPRMTVNGSPVDDHGQHVIQRCADPARARAAPPHAPGHDHLNRDALRGGRVACPGETVWEEFVEGGREGEAEDGRFRQ